MTEEQALEWLSKKGIPYNVLNVELREQAIEYAKDQLEIEEKIDD